MTTATGHTQVIRAKKVIGTSVKNSAGEKIGQVEDIVLDKLSNNIVYAVVGFGGFLGMNEKYHPVPWSALDYVESEDSYVVPFTKDELKSRAGGFTRQADARRWRGRVQREREVVLQGFLSRSEAPRFPIPPSRRPAGLASFARSASASLRIEGVRPGSHAAIRLFARAQPRDGR